jgi:hypothetical protein
MKLLFITTMTQENIRELISADRTLTFFSKTSRKKHQTKIAMGHRKMMRSTSSKAPQLTHETFPAQPFRDKLAAD